MYKALVICGPTATGKTALAIALAKKFNGELVNADSRQVYQGLDALTGKDRSPDVPIHLYDVIAPGQEFSVAHFVRLAQTAIQQIHEKGKLPIVVGGTGFYLQALTGSIDTLDVPPDADLRKTLTTLPLLDLQQRLQDIDQRRWDRMNDSDRKNPRRLIRAIEVARSAHIGPRSLPRYDALWIGLRLNGEVLKQRIGKRVAERFDQAIGEVREGLPPILGVEPLLLFRRGMIAKEEALALWSRAEYQYAKRQMTWFKKQHGIHWFEAGKAGYEGKIEALVRSWYTTSG